MHYRKGFILLLMALSWAVSGSNAFADAAMDRVLLKLEPEELRRYIEKKAQEGCAAWAQVSGVKYSVWLLLCWPEQFYSGC